MEHIRPNGNHHSEQQQHDKDKGHVEHEQMVRTVVHVCSAPILSLL